MHYQIKYLGDVIGGGYYLGYCSGCRKQFMSTHERVAVINSGTYCVKCAEKRAALAKAAA